jgi:hypothetical protein
VSLWLRHLLRQYRDGYGCLPAENDFCVEPSSEDGVGPNQPCMLCRLTDAVIKAKPDEVVWCGEEPGTLTAPVGRDAVATLTDEGSGRWAWRIEDDSGAVIGEGSEPTLASALYRCEREVYEQGLNT